MTPNIIRYLTIASRQGGFCNWKSSTHAFRALNRASRGCALNRTTSLAKRPAKLLIIDVAP